MDASLITLVANVLLALFIVLGFFWGLGRGLKKSALRIVFFVVFSVVAFFLSSVITATIANISITVDGESQTLSELVLSAILSSPEIKDFYDSSTAIQGLITQLPLMVLNVLVFIVLLIIFKFLSWLFFAITARIVFRRKKKKKKTNGIYDEKAINPEGSSAIVLEEKPVKKHRLLGGLVSACQAFLFLFLIMVPINGVTGLINEIAMQTETTTPPAAALWNKNSSNNANTFSADNCTAILDENGVEVFAATEKTASAKLVHEMLGKDVLTYIQAFEDSITAKAFSAVGFDNTLFDGLTQATIEGQKVVLGQEIRTFAQVYNDIAFLLDLDFENMEYSALDFDRIEKAINSLFNSGMFKLVAVDAISYLIDKGLEDGTFDEGEYATLIKDALIPAVKEVLNDENASEQLRTNILAVVSLAEVACTSGLLDALSTGDDSLDGITSVMTQNEGQVIADMLNAVFSSKLLQDFFVSALNITLDDLEVELKNFVNENLGENQQSVSSITLAEVKQENINWTNLATDFKTILYNLFLLADATASQPENANVWDMDIQTILTYAAKMLDGLQNAQILSATANNENIYKQLLSVMAKTKYGDHINFENLDNLSWTTELGALKDFYTNIQPLMKALESEEQNSFTFKAYSYENLSTAINKLFNSNIAKQTKTSIFDLLELDSEDELTNDILNKLKSYNTISDTKNEITNVFDSISILGKTGIIDVLAYEKDDLGNSLTALAVTTDTAADAPTKLAQAVDKLLSSDVSKIVLVYFLNQMLEQMELSQIDKELDWTGWAATKTEFVTISNNLMKSVLNVELADRDELFNDFSLFVNENFADTASKLGASLDILATSQLFVNTSGTAPISIYDELITQMFGDFLTLDKALSTSYTANFWKNELTSLSSALIKADTISIIDNGSEKTLLEVIFEGGDIMDALDKAEISKDDYNAILNPLLASELFRGKVSDVITTLTNELIGLTTNDEVNNVIDNMDEILQNEEQRQDVVDVIVSAVEIKDLTDINDLDLNEQADVFSDILNTMQDNTNENGQDAVFNDAYKAITDFILDEDNANENETIKSIYDVINNTSGEIDQSEIGTDPSNFNWARILELAKLAQQQ